MNDDQSTPLGRARLALAAAALSNPDVTATARSKIVYTSLRFGHNSVEHAAAVAEFTKPQVLILGPGAGEYYDRLDRRLGYSGD